jgi:hypothetical protein
MQQLKEITAMKINALKKRVVTKLMDNTNNTNNTNNNIKRELEKVT